MSTQKFGCKWKDVIKLQLLLNRYLKPCPKLKADGLFGNKTQKALILFQKANNLAADGVAGQGVWKALGVKPKPTSEPSVSSINAPWYAVASAERGITEIRAPDKHNKRILEYHATTTLGAKTDEVPWCSSFVNWVMTQSGIKGTNNALAKSWATWGVKVVIPFKGAVVVMKRKNRSSDSATGS